MPVHPAEGWRLHRCGGIRRSSDARRARTRMPRWLRQPRHGSRAWYCPFTLASGSDPRHESRVALLASRDRHRIAGRHCGAPAARRRSGAHTPQARGFLSLHRRSVRGTPVAHGTAPARRAPHRGADLRTSTTLTVAAALATIASQAGATTFVAMTERALARAADAIVVGTVRHIESVAAPDGAVNTLVTVEVEQEAKGHVGRVVVLKQPGGSVGGRRLWLAGSPDFTVNDRELLFLSAYRDGTARTTAFGMGQFHLSTDPLTGVTHAERTLDGLVVGAHSARRRTPLASLLSTSRSPVADPSATAAAPLGTGPPERTDPGLDPEPVAAVPLRSGARGRSFEADSGQAVMYRVDPAGDNALGPDTTFAAVDGARAAWTNVSGASIRPQRGSAAAPAPLRCDGVSQLVFNDPFHAIPDPVGCAGVLALGGL